MFSLYETLNGYDIQWADKIEITDEKGNELEGKIKVEKDSFVRAMQMLAWGYEQEECIGKTEKFKEKYPYFLDLFEHYSPLTFNHIEFVSERSSWEKKEAYFVVDSILECKKREYLVNFTLDKRGYLDDVKVNKVNEKGYDGNNENRSVKLLYTNSNWQNLEITDNYREKHNGISYNNDINSIDIDYEAQEKLVEDNNYNEYLRLYRMKDGTTSVYYIKYIMDGKGNIDDIECYKLNYENISIEEAKELYLKEHKE